MSDVVDLSVLRPFQPRSTGGRDWLKPSASVHEFYPAITRCGRCGSPHHRASKCPMNRTGSAPEREA